MPTCTYIQQEAKSIHGLKTIKDRITLLLGGNIAGFKIKPLVINQSENPQALKNVNKHTLPVYFRSNRKAWMTKTLFEYWFLNCFNPEVHRYCLDGKIHFEVLLLLDNAPRHLTNVSDLHPNVKVICFPAKHTHPAYGLMLYCYI